MAPWQPHSSPARSAGLGLEFAWQLATAKHDVVLVARDEERLTRLAAQLEAAAGVRAEVLVADLSDRADVERVADRLRADERPVGLLVNNAGLGLNQRFVTGDLAAEEAALDVMVRAVLVLSHAAAGAMVERGRGAILNVASVAALLASGTYSAHKAWVRVFTEGLAVELRGTGVTATALCPGFVHTEFHERGEIDMTAYPEIAWLNAEDVVATAPRRRAPRGGHLDAEPALPHGVGARSPGPALRRPRVRPLPPGVPGQDGPRHRDRRGLSSRRPPVA